MASARELMTSPVITILATATVGDAADLMLERGLSCAPVVDERGALVGMLSHSDFSMHQKFKPLAQNIYSLLGAWANPEGVESVYREIRARQIKEVMSQPVITVEEDTPVGEVVETMLHNHINRVPVMSEKRLVGIITRHDLLKLVSMEP